MRYRSAFCAVAFAATLTGCNSSEPTGTDGPPGALLSAWDNSPARSDSVVYHLRRTPGMYRAYATVTLRNRTSAPLYFARCNPASTTPMFSLGRTGPDSLATFFVDWAWACVGGVPTGELAVGDSVAVQVWLGSVDQPLMTPPLRPEHLVGTLRVSFHLCRNKLADSDYCEYLPRAASESNAFEVRY